MADLPTTQRAYTLRLRGIDKNDNRWRDALWATHEAVNKGAKVFGDWLLTLRGGLSHKLAYVRYAEVLPLFQRRRKEAGKLERHDIKRLQLATELRAARAEAVSRRRTLLAISWLSAEDNHGAPRDDPAHGKKLRVATGKDSRESRSSELIAALFQILKGRQGEDPNLTDEVIGDLNTQPEAQRSTWIADCASSLHGNIREDAVWVNRSLAFDQVTANITDVTTPGARRDAERVLWHLLDKKDYLLFPTSSMDGVESETEDDEGSSKHAKASGEGAGDRSRYCYGHIFEDTGGLTGKSDEKLIARRHWESHLRNEIGQIRELVKKESARKKKPRGCVSPTNLHRQMFAKAASRLAQIWTKQRQQEADRKARKAADAALRKLEEDSKRNDDLAQALRALDKYCEEFRLDSGATGAFRIRPRQILGWDRVITNWAATVDEADAEVSREQRIEAVKSLQDADPDRKFGDVNLFFRLADETYRPVWWQAATHKTNHTILETYVHGRKARSDAERLKVAAYRHPNAFLSPIYCDFDDGTNLPEIAFRRLRPLSDPAIDNLQTAELDLFHPEQPQWARVTLLRAVSRRFDQEIGSACDNLSGADKQLPIVSRRGRFGNAAVENQNVRTKVAKVFDAKLKRSRNGDSQGENLVRFTQAKWPAKLTTDRQKLRAIGELLAKVDEAEECGNKTSSQDLRRQMHERINRLPWYVAVALPLQQLGPWYSFIDRSEYDTPFLRTVRKDAERDTGKKLGTRYLSYGWPWQEFNTPLKKNKAGTELVEDKQAARGGKARLILSRLPGLRLLSIDLGHRFAAACAVWETLSDIEKEVAGRDIIAGGTSEGDLFCHTSHVGEDGKRRTTIYRRIGEDRLGQADHPAPWARLDRQFFIKLQGEDRAARNATRHEIAYVEALEKQLRRDRSTKTPLPKRVDELMSEAARNVRIALQHHGDEARIAYGFNSISLRLTPGGKVEQHTSETRKAAILEALVQWHELAISARWQDQDALERWNNDVRRMIENYDFVEPPPLEAEDAADKDKIKRREEKAARWRQIWSNLRGLQTRKTEDEEQLQEPSERKSDSEAVRAQLSPVADALEGDSAKCEHFASYWADRWSSTDKTWPVRLKQLAGWILPRGLRPGRPIPEDLWERLSLSARRDFARQWKIVFDPTDSAILGKINAAIQSHNQTLPDKRRSALHVGGLSLARIATIRELYQIQKVFRYRPQPRDLRAGVKLIEEDAAKGYKIGDKALQAMEKMREQRVKQLASRIIEAALGVGSENPEHWKNGRKRPDGQLEHHAKGGTRFRACHAVVIENLRHYRPDELQTRRENRSLMSWSSGKVRKYLEEGCQLHGLHLREVMPNYTSRQDSRTGLPGVRCADVPLADFIDKPWWRKAVKRAKARKDKPYDNEAQLLVAVAAAKPSTPLRLIVKGGDLFIAAPPSSCEVHGHKPCSLCKVSRAVQADLNAAANIGLRALLDPDFIGKWWYVPCDTSTGKPAKDKCAGAACLDLSSALISARRTAKGEKINAWRNVGSSDSWTDSKTYWNNVRAQVVAVLAKCNGIESLRNESEKNIADPETPW